jgi:hypothetical protein
MTTTNSKKEITNKRITKNDLNQLAHSRYGEEVYCEHVRSGKRGWYLHQDTEKTFIGVNANEAYQYLQTQEQVPATPISDASVPSSTEILVSSEESVVTTTPVKEAENLPVMPIEHATSDSQTSSESVIQEATTSTVNEQLPVKEKITENEETGLTLLSPEEVTERKETGQAKAALSAEELLELLFEKFPNTFFKEPEKIRPIQKYIHKKIRKALNNEYTKSEISEALILYTQTIDYCQQLMKGGERIDLQGKACGEVSVEHQQDAKARLSGESDMRFQKQKRPKISRVVLPPPKLDELITGKMEVCLKIHELPADSKTTRNGWEEFIIETERHAVKTTVRPKTWKKLQNAGKEYSHWIANIRGQMGPRSKKGFELLTPAVQIFETKPKEQNKSENQAEMQTTTESSSIESE